MRKVQKYGTQSIDKLVLKGTLTLVLVILILILLTSSFFIVRAGERGILLTFGNPSKEAYTEGLHFKFPIAQKAVKMDIKTQKYETGASAASQDLQIVTSKVAVNYHLIPSEIVRLYTEIGVGYRDRVIQPAVQEVVKASTAEFTAEELITKRPEVKKKIEELLHERLVNRGIDIEEISITDFDFSVEFNEAIEQKVTAEQQALKAERDLDRIKIEAQQAEAEAIGLKKAKIANAQGEAESIRIIEQQLKKSPTYIEWLKVTRWDGILPKVTGGAVPFIDIGLEEPRTTWVQ